jgi:hypothetical protein
MSDEDVKRGGFFQWRRVDSAADDEQVLGKLEAAAAIGGGPVEFTPDEAIVLRRVIKVMRGIDALGFMGGGIRKILMWVAGILVVWSQIGDWIVAHLGKGH